MRIISRTLVSLCLVAACSVDPLDSADPFVGDDDVGEISAGLDCSGLELCTGSGAISGASYRIGTTPTSSGELLQTFTVGAEVNATSLRVSLRPLRALASGATNDVLVEVYELNTAGSSPVPTGGALSTATLSLTNGQFFSGDVPLTVSGPLDPAKTYGVLLTAAASDAAQSVVVGVGTWTGAGDPQGAAWRRGRRREAPNQPFGAVRFRPTDAIDLALGLHLEVTTRVLVTDGAGRHWSDGTYAVSCDGYRHPSAPYSYLGTTGDGSYVIKPGTTPFAVTCDMGLDGGGWTLLATGSAPFGSPVATVNLSGANQVLQAAFANPLVAASSGLVRFGQGSPHMFVVDPAPRIFTPGGVPHAYASYSATLRCSATSPEAALAAAPFGHGSATCDAEVVASHTCGFGNGWILWHSGDSYNFGGHPCPAGSGMISIWLR